MPQNPYYVPTKLADRRPWAINLNTLISATPTNYGLDAGDATAIDNVVDPYVAADILATNPATRTAVTITDRDAKMAAMLAVVTPYMVQINSDPAVSDALKVGVGGTARIATKTRNSVVAEETVTTMTLTLDGNPRFETSNPATPDSVARPLGAISWEMELQARNPPATEWTPFSNRINSRPGMVLNRAEFNSVFEYRYRTRWVGALLPGGAPNVGPWSAWSEFMFLPS